MALDATDFIELLAAPRFAIPLIAGIAAGLCLYLLGGRSPSSAVVALGAGVVGLVVGLVWHVAGGSWPGAA
ncbi:hypothetical protein [Luteimonas kalidii]|uniref:Uncharacterized protein n=1 Tax=Luteimonas kalidii TaxID=3042025 RepID=A0ABT6JUR5_9GAMM|nr:hypothetical protein [Luteimonas kalidii]MDH5834222.1 hypothetical protein [Luteimonas kalidii]